MPFFQAYFSDSTDLFRSEIGMTHVRKLLRKISVSEGRKDDYEMVILHVDKRSKGASVRLCDTSPTAGQNLKQAEFKLEPEPTKWQKVTGSFLLALPVTFSSRGAGALLQESWKKTVTEDTVTNTSKGFLSYFINAMLLHKLTSTFSA